MDAFYWFSILLDQSEPEDPEGSGHSSTEESSEVPHSSLLQALTTPTYSSSSSSFLVLPPYADPSLSGISILTPMASNTARPLRPLGPAAASTRCCWRLLRPNPIEPTPEFYHRCTRHGNHMVGTHRVCGHHRSLAVQYDHLDMNWHFAMPRFELPGEAGRRDGTGRFTVRAGAGTGPVRELRQPLTGLNISGSLSATNGTGIRILGHVPIFKPEVVRRMRADHTTRYTGDATCPVCLEDGTVLDSLRLVTGQSETNPMLRTCCGHGLHLHCLGEMVSAHPRPDTISDTNPIKCPLCRADLLATVISHRHLLCHQRFFQRPTALTTLIPDEGELDHLITVLANDNHEIMYFSDRTPGTVLNFWETLGTGLDIPEEVTDYVQSHAAPPAYEPTSPPGSPPGSPPRSPPRSNLVEQGSQPVQPAQDPSEATEQAATPSTPPGVAMIDMTDTPPAAPRRIRRRLNPPSATSWERPRTLFSTVPTGTVTRAPTLPTGSVGIDLTEIIRRFNSGEHVQVFHGSNVDGSTHYSVTAVETEEGQQVLTVVIQ